MYLVINRYAVFFLILFGSVYGNILEDRYNFESSRQVSESDIGEHLPLLRNLAKECSSVVEIGTRSMVSTMGIFMGLYENGSQTKKYLGIDLEYPPNQIFSEAIRLAKFAEIDFDFWNKNDLFIQIPSVDFLFIDSLHTYRHLSYELERFSSQVNNYIALHDTSEPWGETDEPEYYKNDADYPSWINSEKRGLWPAVVDFLERHSEWELHKRYLNCHGFTILKRVRDTE